MNYEIVIRPRAFKQSLTSRVIIALRPYSISFRSDFHYHSFSIDLLWIFVNGVNQNWRLNFNFVKFDSRLLIAFNYQVIKIRVRVSKLGPNLSLVRIRLWSEFDFGPNLVFGPNCRITFENDSLDNI